MTTASVTALVAPLPFGVGRDNRWTGAAPVPARRLAHARSALARWQRRRATAGFRWPALFPYEAVADYLRSVGRNAVDPQLAPELRRVQVWLASSEARSVEGEQLLAWLQMALDVPGGTYDSYLGAGLFAALADRLPMWTPSQVLDTLTAAILADLVLSEAEALDADPSDRRQAGRLRACLQALRSTTRFAPDAMNVRRGPAPALPEDALGLLDVAVRDCGTVLDATPDCVRRAVSITLLPTTTVHDEVMFVRSIQAYECVYHQIARRVDLAIDEILAEDPAAAIAELNDATDRVDAARIIYRVVTTMPPEAFAVIRGATDGRSAIQSRPYNRVEMLCNGTDDTTTRPSFQRLVAQRRLAGPDVLGAELAAAAHRLDQAWRAMKRTHWGIALKIIGRVPGTGGTAGADYLQTKSAESLFPALADDGADSALTVGTVGTVHTVAAR